MKKILSVVLAAIMVFAFAACGNDATNAGNPANSGNNTNEATFNTSKDIGVISREDGSGTRGAFIELFGIEQKNEAGEKVDYTTLEAVITNSTAVMMTTVEGDEYAIGYISLGSLNDTVKALEIDGAAANVDNIKNGSYKVFRPFNIVTCGNVNAETQDFINFIMSADGQAVVENGGYIAVAEGAANYTATVSSGKVVVSGSSSVSPIMEKLKEAYIAANPGMTVEIQTSDSSTGVADAIDGTSNIGMASRELKSSETEKGAVSTVIANDGIAVIVNNDNPTDGLTSEQVMNIFMGNTKTWSEIAQ
ncbi:MAG: substrate-binding domain-containing protein [Clostridia bacterium]|nr:substrate-binding domain-containing protein [Clostridia bacterium]